MSIKLKLLELIDQLGLNIYADDLMSLAQPSIRIKIRNTHTEAELAIGASKLGGTPDLPGDIEYPYSQGKPLVFVAQINMSDLSWNALQTLSENTGQLSFFDQLNIPEKRFHDVGNVLPEIGILYFFLEDEFYKRDAAWKVIYAQDTALLQRRKLSTTTVFRPCAMEFWRDLTLPDPVLHQGELKGWMDWDEREVYWTLRRALIDLHKYDKAGNASRMFGYPDAIQDHPAYECQRRYGLTHFGSGDTRFKQFEQGLREWQLLFQLDSECNAGMMWGDMGRIYYCIRQEDLEKRNFDRVYMDFQCY